MIVKPPPDTAATRLSRLLALVPWLSAHAGITIQLPFKWERATTPDAASSVQLDGKAGVHMRCSSTLVSGKVNVQLFVMICTFADAAT